MPENSAHLTLQADLFIAAQEGNLSQLQSALALGANPQALDENDKTPLQWAASLGHADCASHLLSLTLAADGGQSSIQAAFLDAARSGYTDCLSLLLPHADPHAVDACQCTALHLAAQSGRASCVSLLLPFSDPLKPSRSGATALGLAAQKGHTDCVSLLLPVTDPNLQDHYGFTALHYAAQNGYTDCLTLLLPATDTTPSSEPSITPLHLAAQNGHIDCLTLLLPCPSRHSWTNRSSFGGRQGPSRLPLPFAPAF